VALLVAGWSVLLVGLVIPVLERVTGESQDFGVFVDLPGDLGLFVFFLGGPRAACGDARPRWPRIARTGPWSPPRGSSRPAEATVTWLTVEVPVNNDRKKA